MSGEGARGSLSGVGPAGLLIAAPASASGKTTVTLALLRLLRRRGHRVAAVKVGPDYIDPAFHAAAAGHPCFNLDPWAMRPQTLAAALQKAAEDAELVIGEGVMGLFDGAPVEDQWGLAAGSTASLAAAASWPVVLVVNCRGMGASVAALAHGFAQFHERVRLGGVILNAVASDRHERLLREACNAAAMPVLAVLRRVPGLTRPSRHLGLVQAGEDESLDLFLDAAADALAEGLDESALLATLRPASLKAQAWSPPLEPLGQRIAVARDTAFAFCYPLTLEGWRGAGAELSFFSPLADEGPELAADAVYLPGGYPELHGATLAANKGFHAAMWSAAERGAVIYGECGGYMALGRSLEDAEGQSHEMLGLLAVESSMKAADRVLGYRRARLMQDGPLGPAGTAHRGHEFHYASARSNGDEPLFTVTDAAGQDRHPAGQRRGKVMGSFLHLIDCEDISA